MDKKGRCLCGAVTFEAKGIDADLGACHCGMCRRWTGSAFIAVTPDSVDLSGEDSIATYKSSDWAERGFCKTCGTGLFYRLTVEGPSQGKLHIPFGTLEDPSGLRLTSEIFVDHKTDVFEFAGDHKGLTEAEVFAMYSGH